MAGLSAVDCVGPAVQLTRKRLLEPFRFGYWARIAVIGILAGGLSGGNCNYNRGTGTPITGRSGSPIPGLDPQHIGHWLGEHIALIIALFAVAIAIGLVFAYIGSVMRFVLYEAVLRDRARIREGFARWSGLGFEYFLFQLALMVPFLVAGFVLVGLPLIRMIRLGHGGDIWPALLQVAGGALIVVLLSIVFAVVLVLTKDFVLPQMMFEGIRVSEGWARLWQQIKAEPGSFAGYIGLKIVLSIVAAILLMIVMIVGVLAAAIPVALVVIAGVVVFKLVGGGAVAAGVGIALAILFAVPVMLFAVGFLGAPISVFFPAYSIHYFASRYRPLYDELYPAPPQQAPAVEPAGQ
jgi:hypothetical protein